MALTIGNVITRARYMISDSVADGSGNYRNDDTKLMLYGDDGQKAFVTEHPECAYKDSDTSIDTTGADDITLFTVTTDGLHIRDSWVERLAHYIAARVFGEDAEDIANRELARGHWAATGLKDNPYG